MEIRLEMGDLRQKTELRRQKPGNRSQNTENRTQKKKLETEASKQKEGKEQKAGDRSISAIGVILSTFIW